MLVEFPISFSRGTNLRKRRTTISRTSPHAIIAVGKDKEGQERQRGTGQIRGKVKEDEIEIGIAGARSLSSEPGKGGGVAKKDKEGQLMLSVTQPGNINYPIAVLIIFILVCYVG